MEKRMNDVELRLRYLADLHVPSRFLHFTSAPGRIDQDNHPLSYSPKDQPQPTVVDPAILLQTYKP